MLMKYIKSPPSLSTLRVPGWGGDSTDNKFQFWTNKQLADAATGGIELNYAFEDVSFSREAPHPFIQLSDNFYMLELEPIVITPENTSLLIIPHYRFYTDFCWNTPIPVMSSIELDWWPGKLSIVFKYPPSGYETIFKNGEPFAQAYIIPRIEIKLVELVESDLDRKRNAKLYMEEHKKNLITREWTTPNGVVQDNLYNILSNLEKINKLPKEIKYHPKKKVFYPK
jgi:hypothetical protein